MASIASVFTGVDRRIKAREEAEVAKREAAEQARVEKLLKKEAKYYRKLIIQVAANRGFIHVLRGILEPDLLDVWVLNKLPIRRLKFTHQCLNIDRLYFRIDAGDLPRPVTLADIADEDFLNTVSIACKRKVSYESSISSGAFLVLDRDSSIAGIPSYVAVKEIEKWIQRDDPPLTIAVGQGEYREPIVIDLAELPHALVAGATFSGKSVWLRQMICTLVARNSPKSLRLMVVDLKYGVEFRRYLNLPHMYNGASAGFADTPARAKIVLQEIIEEIDHRGALFAKHKVVDIKEWNDRGLEPMPYLLFIVDELSLLLLSDDKELVKKATTMLNKVLSVGRAFGIHAILCTQTPDKRIIAGFLKANLTAVICFATATQQASMSALGHGRAWRLTPQGRGFFQNGLIQREFQGPMITTKMVDTYIRRIIERGGAVDEATQITLYDLLKYSLDHLDGSLSYRALLDAFSEKGLSQVRAKTLLQAAEGGEFEIEGQWYCVPKPVRGMPRRLLPGRSPASDNNADVVPEAAAD